MSAALSYRRLDALRRKVSDAEVAAKISQFRTVFEVSSACESSELVRAARTSVALDRLVAAHDLGAMAYSYEGAAGNEYEQIVTSVIAGNTLLNGRGVPVAGECEVKNAQAMKILSLLGAGGFFSEFYALDFKDDVVMLGHDGPPPSPLPRAGWVRCRCRSITENPAGTFDSDVR